MSVYSTPAQLKARIDTVLADNNTGDITPAVMRQLMGDIIESQEDWNGWAEYVDTQYTSASPLAVAADTETIIPCNAAAGRRTKEPSIGPLFQNGAVTGIDLESRIVTIDLKLVPTSGATTLAEIWFDLGTSQITDLYRRPITFPKGSGQVRHFTTTTLVYTADTWEAQGGIPKILLNGPANLYDVRFIIRRASTEMTGVFSS